MSSRPGPVPDEGVRMSGTIAADEVPLVAPGARRRILVVEDEALIALDLERRLTRLGLDVVGVADNAVDAVALFQSAHPDIILMDIFIRGDLDGIETARRIHALGDVPVLFLTAFADDATLQRATETSPYGYLVKPFDERGLFAAIRVALERHAVDTQSRLLAAAVGRATNGVAIVDVRGDRPAIRYVNDALVEMSGTPRPDWLGQEPLFLALEPDHAMVRALGQGLATRSHASGMMQLRGGDGAPVWASVTLWPVADRSGHITHMLLFLLDVTLQSQMRRDLDVATTQLVQAQKLTAIGQLAAGVAHEINTPIQFVGDNTVYLEKAFDRLLELAEAAEVALKAPDDRAAFDALAERFQKAKLSRMREQVPRAFEQSKEGLARVTKIVSAMKDFSHPSHGAKEPVVLRDALESTVTIARSEWKYVAGVQIDVPSTLIVPMMRDEFNQVILNLLVNAAHAIAEKQSTTQTDARGLIVIAARPIGDHVEITVSDTGKGIPDDIRARVFEPFFTTKPVGKGTGQGLAIAYSVIVEMHGGTIGFDSKPGEGTTFRIRLPLDPGGERP
jgi:two-component system NtrC family sensor kinase